MESGHAAFSIRHTSTVRDANLYPAGTYHSAPAADVRDADATKSTREHEEVVLLYHLDRRVTANQTGHQSYTGNYVEQSRPRANNVEGRSSRSK